MKKLTMKDFRWLGKPQVWEKTYKELTLTVEGMLCLPEGPLALAVSDEDFTLSVTITTAPEGGFCGICLYHTDQSYVSVGRSKTTLLVETSAPSQTTKTTIALPTEEESIQWHLERKAQQVRIGYSVPYEDRVKWVCSSSMASMQDSISVGVFFSNYTNTPFQAGMHSLRYAKSTEQPLV